jgi:hypothetical protein
MSWLPVASIPGVPVRQTPFDVSAQFSATAAFGHLRITVIARNYVNLPNFCAQRGYRLCLTGNPALRIWVR